MADEIQFLIFEFCAIGATVITLMYGRLQKHKSAWLSLSIFFAATALLGVLQATDIPGLSGPGIPIPKDYYVIPPLIWIVSLIMLARGNSIEKIENQYERIKALNDIARSYLTSKDLEEAAANALARIAKTFGAEYGAIFTMDADTGKPGILAGHGGIPKSVLDFQAGIEKAHERDRRFIADAGSEGGEVRQMMRRLFDETMRAEGFKSLFGAPIKIGGATLGMVAIYSKREMALSKEGKDFLDLLAFELGLWMIQTKSVLRLKQMSDIQKGLLDISVELQEGLGSERTLKSIVEQLIGLIPCRDIWIYLYDPVKNAMRPAQAIGKDAQTIMADKEFPMSEAGLAGAILKKGKAEIVPDALADGRGKHIEGTGGESSAMLVIPLIVKGEPIGVIELSRDLPAAFTQRELETAILFAQQASIAIQNARLLEQTEREKDKSKLYLDLLTHDIANLNTPLYSYLDMMLKDEKIDARSKQMMGKAYAQIEKISTLLSRVRKLSKAELEEMEEQRCCEPSEMLNQAVIELKRAFPHREIEIDFKDLEEKCSVAAGEMVDEVFFNILHNAVKFSPKDVRIEITLEEMEIEGKWYCAVRVCDHGTGVPDDMKPQVFEKPKAAAASFARGFGIGLNTCKKLVEKYGGSIWVEDRVEGNHAKGACFVVTLPLIKPGDVKLK